MITAILGGATTDKEIADEADVQSPSTVSVHRRNIAKKLSSADRKVSQDPISLLGALGLIATGTKPA